MDRTFSPLKAADIKTGDLVLTRNPYRTHKVIKTGWYYSQHLDKDYFQIDFASGHAYHSNDGQEVFYVSTETRTRPAC